MRLSAESGSESLSGEVGGHDDQTTEIEGSEGTRATRRARVRTDADTRGLRVRAMLIVNARRAKVQRLSDADGQGVEQHPA
jgi:hypothetical protein